MACEDIQQRLGALRSQKRQLEDAIENLQGPGLQAAQENLANLSAQIAAEQRSLADCQAIAGSPSQPFVGRAKEIYCAEASMEKFKDEPYILIAAIDMRNRVQVGPVPLATVPTVHCVKVGPWQKVKAGNGYPASVLPDNRKPAFWDLDGEPRIIASPEDVVILAGVVENDGASPDTIRGLVHTALEASILVNVNRAYDAFAATLASAMAGAIDQVLGAGIGPGHANFDDRIGDVMQLRFTDEELDTVNAHGTLEKELTFTRKNSAGKINNQYTVTFVFET